MSVRALLYAAYTGDVGKLREHLEQGIHVDTKEESQGYTSLHQAAGRGHTACIELLLGAKANIGAVDCEMRTPLQWAELSGQNTASALLSGYAARVNSAKKQGGGFSEDSRIFEEFKQQKAELAATRKQLQQLVDQHLLQRQEDEARWHQQATRRDAEKDEQITKLQRELNQAHAELTEAALGETYRDSNIAKLQRELDQVRFELTVMQEAELHEAPGTEHSAAYEKLSAELATAQTELARSSAPEATVSNNHNSQLTTAWLHEQLQKQEADAQEAARASEETVTHLRTALEAQSEKAFRNQEEIFSRQSSAEEDLRTSQETATHLRIALEEESKKAARAEAGMLQAEELAQSAANLRAKLQEESEEVSALMDKLKVAETRAAAASRAWGR